MHIGVRVNTILNPTLRFSVAQTELSMLVQVQVEAHVDINISPFLHSIFHS